MEGSAGELLFPKEDMEGMFWKESHIYRAMLIVRGIIAKHSPISNTNRKKKLELDALNCLGEGLQV